MHNYADTATKADSALQSGKGKALPTQFAFGKLYHICGANISHPSKTDISHFFHRKNISPE